MLYRKTIDLKRNRIIIAFYDDTKHSPVMHVLEKKYYRIHDGERLSEWRPLVYLCSRGEELGYDTHEKIDWREVTKEKGRQLWDEFLDDGFDVVKTDMEWKKERPRPRPQKLSGYFYAPYIPVFGLNP
jgi:hypothetical protein